MPKDVDRPVDKFKEKVFQDCIHGHIVLPPAAVAIVDTEQFQRLRDLKQVGNCHLVYMNTIHCRFEHSIGVAHLAFMWGEALIKRYPDRLDRKDVLCLMLAGLCHDMGHGPYSHLWDQFVNEANPGVDYRHEDSSLKMIDHMLEYNELKPILKDLAGIDEADILFIKEAIAGPLGVDGLPIKKEERRNDVWEYKGRPEEKAFLYEIVANKWTGVDVDKWDYLLRDDYCMKIGHVFHYERFIKYSRIGMVNNRWRIVLRDKEITLLSDMFNDRSRLFRHGYQHRVVLIYDRMTLDAWRLADGKVPIQCNGKELKLSEASVESIVAHEKLTDSSVKHIIMESRNPDAKKAQEMYKRMAKRQLYVDVYTRKVRDIEDRKKRLEEEEDLLAEIQEFVPEEGDLKKEDFTIIRRRINNGEKEKELQMPFYKKNDESAISTVCVPLLDLPEDSNVLFVCVKRCEVKDEAEAVIRAWKENQLTNAEDH